jgi:lipoprotein-anchoring transpeptidase ErfK/SrfK
MQPNQLSALKILEQAQNALKSGDRSAARQLATQAARLAPELEDVWLLMAALARPQASVEYLRQALQINPHSQRAQKGLAWAMESLRKEQAEKAVHVQTNASPLLEPITAEKTPLLPAAEARAQPRPKPLTARPKSPRNRKSLAYAALLGLLLVCLIGGVFLASAVTPVSALFSLVSGGPAWAQVPDSKPIAAPSALPTEIPSFTPAPTATLSPTQPVTAILTATALSTATASQMPSPSPTLVPSEIPTEAASPTPLPTDTPEPTLEPTLESLPTRPAAAAQPPVSGGASSSATGGTHWIDVDLTNQMVYAYEGQTVVNSFVVSTGAAPRLTVTGSYHVYERHVKGNMWGPGYFLPDVPYIMYFHKGFALHGTYWHSNFGTPMSHGCVNLSIPDAEWLYYWSSMGTLVKVHY